MIYIFDPRLPRPTHCQWCGAPGARRVRVAFGERVMLSDSGERGRTCSVVRVCPDCEAEGVLSHANEGRRALDFEVTQ